MKYYGLHACLALFENRAADIIRVYLTESRLKQLGPLLRWCVDRRKAYHVVSDDDMQRITTSVHHEGVCLLAKEPAQLDDAALLTRLSSLGPQPTVLLYLDGVQNPHNIGSILRTAAHFGVPFLLGAASQLPRLSPSAIRVAEGGLERVAIAALNKPHETLSLLRQKGFSLLTTSSHEGSSLFETSLPSRSIIILGAEVQGVSPRLMNLADVSIRIPGTSAVESLNVGVASGLLLGEFWRQRLT